LAVAVDDEDFFTFDALACCKETFFRGEVVFDDFEERVLEDGDSFFE
jgi:hypothetical protein